MDPVHNDRVFSLPACISGKAFAKKLVHTLYEIQMCGKKQWRVSCSRLAKLKMVLNPQPHSDYIHMEDIVAQIEECQRLRYRISDASPDIQSEDS